MRIRTSMGFGRLTIALGAGLAVWAHAAAAQDRELSGDFPEVYRTGGMNAPEWAFFEGPSRAGFDGAGNLHILDTSAGRVVVLDSEGGLARIIGRQGEGPGEFNRPMDLAVWRDGRFAVFNLGHTAYQLFTPDGEFERLVRVSAGQGPGAMFGAMRLGIKPDPLGNALIAQGAPAVMNRMGSLFGEMLGDTQDSGDAGVDDRGLERLGLDGDVVSSTPVLQGWRVPQEEVADDLSVEDLTNPSAMIGMLSNEPFFEPGFHWDVLPDGTIAHSDSSAFAIKLADADGQVTDVLTRSISPEAVTEGIREGMIAHALRELEEQSEDPQFAEASAMAAAIMPGMMAAMREATENRGFLDEVPVVREVRATWDGSLWIQRRGEDPWDDDGPIDVFDANREYVGTFAAAAPGMPAAFGPDGMVLYWETDELDVPTIVVKRLPDEIR
ncbi:MAG: hypothetical protein F4Y73_17255 [Gemmatimonadetes bacterium]|nr:hypothetical protein [Gemmatimonadota bacterium]